jgi:hypothetical protein
MMLGSGSAVGSSWTPLLTRPRLWFRLPRPRECHPTAGVRSDRDTVCSRGFAEMAAGPAQPIRKVSIGPPGAGERASKMNGPMTSLNGLREQGQMTWSEGEQGWTGAPAEILAALAADGFAECKREMTTSRRDCQPVGGVWQGVNPRTRSVASLIWVARPAARPATLFIEIDGEPLLSL